jgi:enolase 1/2/3
LTKTTIAGVHGRRVWDSRGRPTVEAEVTLAGGAVGRAIAPAGASTGTGEAVDLRDRGERFDGLDVTKAVEAVETEIAGALTGLDSEDQETVDNALIQLDGTPNKARLGGNAIIAVSMASAHARAAAEGVPLWQSLAGGRPGPFHLPLPEIQLFGGGAHAARRVDIQDFMVVATGADTFKDALDMTADVYRTAGDMLSQTGRLMGVADEGGYWPAFDTNEEALALTVAAIERAGFTPGDDIGIALDVAASEFGREGRYRLARDSRNLDRDGMIELLLGWVARYPIVSIEDPLAEDDEAGLIAFTQAAGPRLQIVGDDYLVTNAGRVRHAQAVGACNAVLVKPNQAGTLTETRAALDAANAGGWGAIVSARSGESEDVTIVHLAVGWGAKQLKVGSFARSERMAKWNEGLRIAEALGDGALPPRAAFPWGKGG